jgi:hypothetical protein
MKIWECKIGEVDAAKLPSGADLPMRQAVSDAYFNITGERPEFIFSGWGGELDEVERHVVDNKQVHPATEQAPVDAVLKEASIHDMGRGPIAFGKVYADRKGRFKNGESIRTSLIISGPDANGVIRTRNSVYQLEMAA